MIARPAILLVLVPALAHPQAPLPVPADSRNNRLVVSVENSSTWRDAESLQVQILRQPSGVRFRERAVKTGLLGHGQTTDVTLSFDVDREVLLDRPDTVELGIQNRGESLWHRSLSWVFTGPTGYRLDQNFPNPFNPTTTIRYALPEPARVSLVVFDLLGQEVRTLVRGPQEKGYRAVCWDATNGTGLQTGNGVYFYRLEARPLSGSGTYVQTRKMTLLR